MSVGVEPEILVWKDSSLTVVSYLHAMYRTHKILRILPISVSDGPVFYTNFILKLKMWGCKTGFMSQTPHDHTL